MSGRVFIVDDDAAFARGLARLLRDSGCDVTLCGTGAEARAQFRQADADVAVLDYQLPDGNGIAVMDDLKPMAAGAVFVIASAYPNLEVAVEAMRRGAFDYVQKGVELHECMLRIERAIEVALLRRRMAETTRSTADVTGHDGLIGDSLAMRALRARINAVAASPDTTALIVGETGTGKGVISRAIHARSSRAYEPFVVVDCTTIPATLVETELFGHEKGAFSGATSAKMGRVEAAGRGTLFLDEIGELDLPVQAKLLRLLEEREFTRIGGTQPRKLQARIITATNRDLERAVSEGRFRADLRYRLEVFLVESPPLRDRAEDLFLLTAHFVAERARALGRPEPRLHPKVIEVLPKYPFPGNVRELRNMVEQAMLLAERDELTLDEFPLLARAAVGWQPPASVRPPHMPTPTNLRAPRIQSFPPPPLVPKAFQPALQQRARSAPPPARAAVKATFSANPPPAVAPDDATLHSIRKRAQEGEREALIAALEESKGNVSQAARRLGWSRQQVLRRIAKHSIR